MLYDKKNDVTYINIYPLHSCFPVSRRRELSKMKTADKQSVLLLQISTNVNHASLIIVMIMHCVQIQKAHMSVGAVKASRGMAAIVKVIM